MSKEREKLWRRLLSLSVYLCSVPIEKHVRYSPRFLANILNTIFQHSQNNKSVLEVLIVKNAIQLLRVLFSFRFSFVFKS